MKLFVLLFASLFFIEGKSHFVRGFGIREEKVELAEDNDPLSMIYLHYRKRQQLQASMDETRLALDKIKADIDAIDLVDGVEERATDDDEPFTKIQLQKMCEFIKAIVNDFQKQQSNLTPSEFKQNIIALLEKIQQSDFLVVMLEYYEWFLRFAFTHGFHKGDDEEKEIEIAMKNPEKYEEYIKTRFFGGLVKGGWFANDSEEEAQMSFFTNFVTSSMKLLIESTDDIQLYNHTGDILENLVPTLERMSHLDPEDESFAMDFLSILIDEFQPDEEISILIKESFVSKNSTAYSLEKLAGRKIKQEALEYTNGA